MQVYVINALNELSDAEFECALSKIDPEQKDRIMRFHFIEDKKRALAGILLSKYAIAKVFGISLDEIRVEKNKYGKPHVVGKRGVHFNISHSGDYVVCAVAGSPVGIDVQEISGQNLDVADRFFSQEERDALAMCEGDAKRKLFYEIWSLKEAYIKCIGMGLSKPLDEFGVFKEAGKYRLIDKGERIEEYHFCKYDIDERYSLCVCSQDASIPTESEYVKFKDLCLI
ncbi:MAG: 4'-phosphopantetheinyl transferase superfamily protein [Butyrivibrio hungatei]|nr:4'-phosphopantetheinyl transferase superfamily protein [Butyrivibrio hungatei]